MERERDDRTGFDSLADGTGMDRRDDEPAMSSGKVDPSAENDEATGDEKTAVEGVAGIGALNQAWGGPPTNAEGGAGTHVPTDDDQHTRAVPDESKDSSDPRGY